MEQKTYDADIIEEYLDDLIASLALDHDIELDTLAHFNEWEQYYNQRCRCGANFLITERVYDENGEVQLGWVEYCRKCDYATIEDLREKTLNSFRESVRRHNENLEHCQSKIVVLNRSLEMTREQEVLDEMPKNPIPGDDE